MRIHPRDSLLLDALRHALGWEKVLQHVERCAKCRERVLLLKPSGSLRGHAESPDYGPALERSFRTFEALSAALGKERREAPGLLARLIGLSKGQQQILIRNSSRFQTWGLFELLIQIGREETFTDSAHAEDLLSLALDVSDCLDGALYGKEQIEDLRARTWGHLGNALRVRREFAAAEQAFEEASQRLPKGSEDPLEQAVLLDLQASLRRDQERLEEARRYSNRAITIFGRMGETHLAGRALVNLSTAQEDSGNIEKKLSVIRRSLELVDSAREPRAALCSMHNFIRMLTVAGQLMEAQRVLARSRPLYQRFREPMVQSRRMWIEADLLIALGRYQEAEEMLADARAGFVRAGAAHESGLVSRDLAAMGASAAQRRAQGVRSERTVEELCQSTDDNGAILA